MPRQPLPSHLTLKTTFAFILLASCSAAATAQSPIGGNSVINPTGEQWTSIGPSGMPLNNLDVISGQVNAVAVDPRDANTVYAGASDGGVWKTTDGGFTWRQLADLKLVRSIIRPGNVLRRKGTSAIGDIAIDQGRPNTIYAGTGNPNMALTFSVGAASLGVFRSTDAGETWVPLGTDPLRSTCPGNARMSQATVFKLLVISGNPTMVYAATDMGLFRYSEDNSDCWTGFSSLPLAKATDIIVDNFRGHFYAAFPDNGIYKSTDPAVGTWTKLTGGLPTTNIGRIALAFGGRMTGASAPEPLVYAGYEMIFPPDNRAYQLYKTVNGGNGWTQLPSPPNESSIINFANSIAVGMFSSDDVYVGQIGLWRALDGGRKGGLNNFEPTPPVTGNSWFSVGCCQRFENVNPLRRGLEVHADIHDIVFAPQGSFIPTPEMTQIVYIANDGGVSKGLVDSADTITWRPMTQGLTISQIGTIAIRPSDPSVTVSGLWHNGNTWSSTNAVHPLPIGGGDGFETGVDAGLNPDGGNTVYHNCNAGNGGAICRSKTGPSLSPPSEVIWSRSDVFRFWSDPYRPGHLLLLTWGGLLMRHKTANTSPANEVRDPSRWQPLIPSPGKTGTTKTIAFRSAHLDETPVYYLGTDSGQVWRGSTETSWTKICECGQEIVAIGPDLTKNERIFVVQNAPVGPGRIKELTRKADGSWTSRNIDENFRPELEVSELTSIVVDPIVTDPTVTTVYVGTDQGVYRGRFQEMVIGPGATAAIPGPTGLQWTWTRSPGVPHVRVTDLEVHQSRQLGYQTGIIRAATFGRSNYQLDRSPGRVVQRYPLALEVTAAATGSELPRPLKVQIAVTQHRRQVTQNAPFQVNPNAVTELVLTAPPQVRDEDGRVLRFAGWVVDGERRGVRNTISLSLDQITKAVAHYAVEAEPNPPKGEPPRVSLSAEGEALCVAQLTHQLKVAWLVLGTSPVTTILEFRHPDQHVEIEVVKPLHGTQRFVVDSPKGGIAKIKVTVVDANKASHSAETTVLLPPCR